MEVLQKISQMSIEEARGVLAASGAGATLVCDPMVDPRGGAYTVGLGLVSGTGNAYPSLQRVGKKVRFGLADNGVWDYESTQYEAVDRVVAGVTVDLVVAADLVVNVALRVSAGPAIAAGVHGQGHVRAGGV